MIAMSLERDKHVPLSSSAWIEEFWSNAARREALPWEQWTKSDRKDRDHSSVIRSLAIAGRLRSTDRHDLARLAREHADATGETDYWTAFRLMIHERERHAIDIARCAGSKRDADGTPENTSSTLDEALVDLVVEQITWSALLQCIRRSSESVLVRRLCDQVLVDDERHLAFVCEKLALLQNECARPIMVARSALIHARVVTGLVRLWLRHVRVFRLSGRTFAQVLSEAREKATSAIVQMNPSYWLSGTRQIDEPRRTSPSIRSAASNRFTARSLAS